MQFPKFIWLPSFSYSSCCLLPFFQDQEKQKAETSYLLPLLFIIQGIFFPFVHSLQETWQSQLLGQLLLLPDGVSLLWLTFLARITNTLKGQYWRTLLSTPKLLSSGILLQSNLGGAPGLVIKKAHVILTESTSISFAMMMCLLEDDV